MFSYKEAEKLKQDCINALNNAGHRNKRRKSNKRKQRSDKRVVDQTPLNRIQVKEARKLGYSNWGEWQEKTGLESPDNIQDDYSEDSRA